MRPHWWDPPGKWTDGCMLLYNNSQRLMGIVNPLNYPFWDQNSLMGYHTWFQRLVLCNVFHLKVWVPMWDMQKRYPLDLCRALTAFWVEDHPPRHRICQDRYAVASSCTHLTSWCLLWVILHGLMRTIGPLLSLMGRRGSGPIPWNISRELCRTW